LDNNEGYGFQYLEDKIAGYVLSLTANAPAPQILCYITDVTELAACLTTAYNGVTMMGGIVIEATHRPYPLQPRSTLVLIRKM
jgi:hypothetical protein